MVGLFGMTNAPFAIWIDEAGTIVRPAEVAFAPRQPGGEAQDQAAFDRAAARTPAQDHRADDGHDARPRPVRRRGARLGGARRARASTCSPEAEVIERSRPRPPEFGLAAAHFELAQHLHRAGFPLDAVPHFQEAHRLDPTNWSYHREALSLVDPEVGQVYERDMLSEVEAVGPETFYPALDM